MVRMFGMVFIVRRNVGVIVRQSSVKISEVSDRPSSISKCIERVARDRTRGSGTVDLARVANLVDAVCSRIDQFTAMEVRTISHGVASIFGRGDRMDRWGESIAKFTLKRARIMPVYVLYPLINSICRIGYRDPQFLDVILGVAEGRMEEANSIDLATIAQTLTLLDGGGRRKSLLKAIAKAATNDNIRREISSTNAVLLVYSFSKCRFFEPGLFESLLGVITALDHRDFEPHLIPLVLHSLANLKLRNLKETPRILDYAEKTAKLMGPENISSCIHSMAKLGIRHKPLVEELTKRTKEIINSIRVREMSNIIWGMSKLKDCDLSTLKQLIEHSLKYTAVDPMSFAQIIQGICRYKSIQSNLVESVESVESVKSVKSVEYLKYLGIMDILRRFVEKYLESFPGYPTQIITQVARSCITLRFFELDILEKSLKELRKRKLSSAESYHVKLLYREWKLYKQEKELL